MTCSCCAGESYVEANACEPCRTLHDQYAIVALREEDFLRVLNRAIKESANGAQRTLELLDRLHLRAHEDQS